MLVGSEKHSSRLRRMNHECLSDETISRDGPVCDLVYRIDVSARSATLLLVLQMELVRERPQPPLLATAICHPPSDRSWIVAPRACVSISIKRR